MTQTRILKSSFFWCGLLLSKLVEVSDQALDLVVNLEYLTLTYVHRLLLAVNVTVHYFEILLNQLKLYLCPGKLLV